MRYPALSRYCLTFGTGLPRSTLRGRCWDRSAEISTTSRNEKRSRITPNHSLGFHRPAAPLTALKMQQQESRGRGIAAVSRHPRWSVTQDHVPRPTALDLSARTINFKYSREVQFSAWTMHEIRCDHQGGRILGTARNSLEVSIDERCIAATINAW